MLLFPTVSPKSLFLQRVLVTLPMAGVIASLGGCFAKSNEQTPLALQQTQVPAAWQITKGAGVRLAILSTGIDLAHPDLPTVVAARSFVSSEMDNVQDVNGAGTQDAGIIAAKHNTIGTKGIAPEIALLVGKVLQDNGSGSVTGIVSGIEWAVAEHADIILADFTTSQDNAALRDAVNAAWSAGALVIAPAGYGGTTTPQYPASYESVQSIGAVDERNARLSASNYGDTLSVMAPGQNVLTTAPVGTGKLGYLTRGNQRYENNIITGSHLGEVTAAIYDCGTAAGDAGNSCPDAVAGNIALVHRGTIPMQDKALHAQSKGAAGLIIANNTAGNFNATLNYDSPLVAVTISQADGDALQALGNVSVTLAVKSGDLMKISGTSQAAAHAAGVAALIKSANPTMNNVAIRQRLESTAQDLGAVGFDSIFGHGLINAEGAVLRTE